MRFRAARARLRRWRWPLRLGLAAALVWLSLAPGDPALYPPGGAARVPVMVVDHGYHAGLVVRRDDLLGVSAALRREQPALARLLWGVAARWPGADWLEIGWGDAAFYRATRTAADIELRLALPALLWPTEAVVQVVPGLGAQEAAFPLSDRLLVALSPGGWRALAIGLGESLASNPAALPEPVGPSLYGEGLFFRSTLSYHAGFTCNQWVAGLLNSAGLPASWFWSITSTGLMQELRWRAGPTDLG